MSRPRLLKKADLHRWQYHPRSDYHSKLACWGILFDLLSCSELLRTHAAAGKIAFGINHRMVDHTNGRKKDLDLVICRPVQQSGEEAMRPTRTFAAMADEWHIDLTASERDLLATLPSLFERPAGSVLMALEAKACMTEFGKARPRLYDELTSSHSVVHGDTDAAIAVGFVMINGSSTFLSPLRHTDEPTKHDQPQQLQLTIEKVRALPRREAAGKPGFDAIAAVAVRCANDGIAPVTIITDTAEGAVAPQDVLHYDTMINRIIGIYNSRFPVP